MYHERLYVAEQSLTHPNSAQLSRWDALRLTVIDMNNLISTRVWQAILEKEYAALEVEIQAALERESCNPSDLTLEYCYFPAPGQPRFKVRRVTAEEKWLAWMSAN